MGNKRDPRKVTVGVEPTLLSDLQTRKKITIYHEGNELLGLHRKQGVANIADYFPLPGAVFFQDDSSDAFWAIASAPTDVWIWETEI